MDKFKLGVRRASKKLMQMVHPSLVISPRALKLVEVLISDLNEKAVASLVKNGKTTGKKKQKKPIELKAESAQKVIEDMLPGLLKKCALAEAHKCLTKFSAGSVLFARFFLR
ncbi:hypothetical protein TNIN_443761 [Trichonephila inaurata madagascariensis]|uniref:Uncharacterized protein n=1 Tax=Trichonephila inaurata madagascariensis TaxID=2747483 RepID=A0A8X6K8B2_9ARAC|nr:hypothetical protein TNIN_443761 [Trichonephila inaurata madagascariensis]